MMWEDVMTRALFTDFSDHDFSVHGSTHTTHTCSLLFYCIIFYRSSKLIFRVYATSFTPIAMALTQGFFKAF